VSLPLEFSLPADLSAKEPPELRESRRRDCVRLLVLNRTTGKITHSSFRRFLDFLVPGDLLVFNSSRTLPALLKGRWECEGTEVEMRLASHLPDDSWLALIRGASIENRHGLERRNSQILFGLGLSAILDRQQGEIPGMWKVRFSTGGSELIDLIYRLGQPVRYRYVSKPFALNYYQTVYANDPGSAEMPSAGRAFTWETILGLRKAGVEMAYITLHTGLSSFLDDDLDRSQPNIAEEYHIGKDTALKIGEVCRLGKKVIAVGTTVVRALESAAVAKGHLRAGRRYTRLRITPQYRLRITDGILTGLHEPAASHLQLLSAFVAPASLKEAYDEAVRLGYLWHEFGDLNLIV
jgi:S-adenosylmethionine:tRNA ribosyltransferase-isomerase